jgi:predicted unusual protein kinase regulating ubiquinone biosynthesis (AarF/ABC1/UbiB family)
MDYSVRLKLLRAFSSFLAALFRSGISHADMKACNVFVPEPGSFRLLDVEDIRFGKVGQNTIVRTLVQLNLSVPGRVMLKDRLRFLSMVTRGFPFDRRRVLKAVAGESLKGHVVYVGVRGTVLERCGEDA